MALLDGKQMRDDSLSLDKLSGTTGLVTFTSSATMSFSAGTSLTTADANILVGTDVVNKNYVDSVSSGLNPKSSSRSIYHGQDITLEAGYAYVNGTAGVGATLTFTTLSSLDFDGVTITTGDRVIINSNVDSFVNGIYDVTNATVLTRSTDFDGSPAQEVDGGEYSFVTEGTLYADTGWVVSSPNSAATIGTTPIIWTKFSSAGVITAGSGMTQVGSAFNVNGGVGLSASGTEVFIKNTGVIAGSYGSPTTVAAFDVNAQGQLTSISDVLIQITTSQIDQFQQAIDTIVFDVNNFIDSSTINFDVTPGVSAEVIDGSLGTDKINSNGAGATAGYNLQSNGSGEFNWVLSTGDISEVVTSTGITGGTNSGVVTLSVDGTNGITSTDSGVKLGGTLIENTTINGSGFDVTLGNIDYLLFTASSAFDVESNFVSLDSGTGSTQILSGTDTTISAGGDLGLLGTNVEVVGTFSVNTIQIDPLLASTGQALVFDGMKFAPGTISGDISGVTAGSGLTGGGTQGSVILGVDLGVDGGLTFSGNSIIADVDGSTITIVGGKLTATGDTSKPVYSDMNQSVTTPTSGDDADSTAVITTEPSDYSRVTVYVNGQLQHLGDGTTSADCYFGATSGTAESLSDLTGGEKLWWNETESGFNLSTTDKIDVIYEA